MSTFILNTRFCVPTKCIIRNLGTEEHPHYCALNFETGEPQLFINTTDPVSYHDAITVKDYSENEGLVRCLIKEGLIENTPISSIQQPYETVGIYKITEKFKSCIQ